MKNVVIVGAGKEGKGTFGDIFYENKWNITFIDKDENVLPMIPAGGTIDDVITQWD